jgi:hypothetical protein
VLRDPAHASLSVHGRRVERRDSELVDAIDMSAVIIVSIGVGKAYA